MTILFFFLCKEHPKNLYGNQGKTGSDKIIKQYSNYKYLLRNKKNDNRDSKCLLIIKRHFLTRGMTVDYNCNT